MPSIVNLSWLPPIFAQASERLNLGELGGATVWLAVTGLSRSGKTVFITSLVHNLLSSAHNPNRMPLLGVVGERRLIAATVEGAGANRLPRFPYLSNIEKMAIPDWPARTADISEIGIEVRFAPAGTLGKLLSEITGSPASLTIRIVDYPGEWLLDLPLMAERFEVYKREQVVRFYQDHFRQYSRQIVLVDVLRALLAGRDAFDDTRLALDAILESLRYGHGGILSKLLLGPHIDKVLFAATKADHVPDIQRDHLAALLRNMAAFPALEVRSSNAQLDVTALASVISTAEDTQEIDGQRLQVVVGRPVGSKTQSKFFVGNVPIRPPRADAWGSPFLNVPVFEPPAIDPSPVEGIAHINLDLALEFLLGDRLR